MAVGQRVDGESGEKNDRKIIKGERSNQDISRFDLPDRRKFISPKIHLSSPTRITKSLGKLEFTEDMLMYLLGQILSTNDEKIVQSWLESASSSDKEHVMGLLKTALNN